MMRGSCHCERVRFEVDGVVERAHECNCSYCARRGLLLWFVPRDALTVTAGADALGAYRFHRRVIEHLFCETCGVQPFGHEPGPDGEPLAAVNLRCVEEIDLGAIEIQPVDGASY